VTPSGSWVELPNVRPIPSTYYNAVHQWDPIVNHFAKVYGIDPDLIRRIIYVESKGYQYAYVASTGVKGLMQITPSWFKAGEDPYDPWTNIGKGAYILRAGYNTYHTWFLAVTWYCYGPLGRYGGNVPTFYAGLIFSPIIRSL
jgi:soluble lytic murein transglycosylase-like protein